jgi:hypothetical protein
MNNRHYLSWSLGIQGVDLLAGLCGHDLLGGSPINVVLRFFEPKLKRHLLRV